ncbi:MAG TPA: HD domain-containing protein [Gemmatimonadaceae bacterium]|nr:HD domain-containing protein [Gemmatimonadaceae bacterium]
MFDIIRDPLWNNIILDDLAIRLVDTRAFQRLRYVRQLGLAYLVYPGATHTRFEHALGAWHLAGRTIELLQARGDLKRQHEGEARVVATAALLHDIGHYPFSHALEEIGAPHHEDVAGALLTRGEIADVLRETIGKDAPERVVELIRGKSTNALQGLISGSLDLDKIEYLKRDALMCGVPYGEIDVDRLIHSLTLVTDPANGRTVIGVSEKGLAALESLLFAKYQMYRNVYWHHAVRSATAMYKRLVADAIESGALRVGELASFSDESLLHQLEERAPSPLLRGLRERRLFKRAFECPSAELPEDAGEWIASDRRLTAAAEDQIARELGLELGEVLLDYPVKTQMLDLDLPVLHRNGTVRRLTGEGLEGSINLPMLSNELYRSARWLRVFVARPVQLERKAVVRLATMPLDKVKSRVANAESLLT